MTSHYLIASSRDYKQRIQKHFIKQNRSSGVTSSIIKQAVEGTYEGRLPYYGHRSDHC